MQISKKKGSPKLLLPRIIYRKSSEGKLNATRIRLPDSQLQPSLADLLTRLQSISQLDGKPTQNSLINGLMRDIVQLSEKCADSENKAADRQQSSFVELDMLKNRMKKMQNDLQYRREQVVRLQNRLRTMENYGLGDQRTKTGSQSKLTSVKKKELLTKENGLKMKQQTPMQDISNIQPVASEYYGTVQNPHTRQTRYYSTIRSPSKEQPLKKRQVTKTQKSVSRTKLQLNIVTPSFQSPKKAKRQQSEFFPTELPLTSVRHTQVNELPLMSQAQDPEIVRLQKQITQLKEKHSRQLRYMRKKYHEVEKASLIYKHQCQELTEKLTLMQRANLQRQSKSTDHIMLF